MRAWSKILFQKYPRTLSQVACESAVKNTMVMVFGEITSNAVVPYEQIIRHAIKQVGYDDMGISTVDIIAKGFDYKTAVVIVALD